MAQRGHQILTVDQLPDSRRAILITLKQKGAATIAQLAGGLQLTGEAVRQQLLQLHRDGWIEARIERTTERGRTGRPATTYSLTASGDHLFPKSYDLLTIAMIDAVAEEFGPDAAKTVLARVCDDKVTANEPAMHDLPIAERVAALKNLYSEDDPYMEAQQVNGGWRLVERNCPYYNTAMQRPALCSVSVNALTRLLGVRVSREETFQSGDGRCVFKVHVDEPVDAARWKFRLEGDLST